MFKRKKILVIGSGFGGLSAAIRLASQGHEVTILEKLDNWGGRAYQHSINGFKFDGGPTVITAPYQYDELFSLAGKRREDYFQLVPLDPFYRIFKDPETHFDYWRNTRQAEFEVSKFNPADCAGYRKFIKGTTELFNWFHPYTEKSFNRFKEFARIFPHVLGSGTWRSMYGYAAQYIQDDFLRKVCSFHPLLIGGNPFDTPSIYGLIIQFEREWGVHYATGGTGAIVNGLGQLFRECGGTIHFNTEVAEILIRNQQAVGVRLQDGTRLYADEVICNGDIGQAYQQLLPPHEVPRAYQWRMKNKSYSNSLFVLYFGTKYNYAASKLQHHNLILDGNYRQLMGDIFDRKKLPGNLGLYIHMPSRTDTTIAPEGCGSFYALSLVPNLTASLDWEQLAPSYTDQLLSYLQKNYLPDLKQNIVAQHTLTPLDFKNRLNSYQGAAFSIKPSMLQSGYFRPQVKSPHFEHLYFVGAGV
ncbi:MAG: phytoene desaturase family protein, partial [Chitinophagaceae bacterium]